MFETREKQRVPAVTFKTRRNNEWLNISSDDIFAEKTVVVFSLPGAFTPTCSSSHVPRFDQLAPSFFKNGVDSIVCISVNDTFVMNEWQKDQDTENVIFIPDGNGEFTEKMGMLVNKDDLGFGKRSWRYSMLVKDGVIDKMFIEPNVPGDPFDISDADTMLDYVNPNAAKPDDITLFTKKGCAFCAKAKSLLEDHDMAYEEIQASKTVSERSLRAVTGADKYPQIFVNGVKIGGSEELASWLANIKAA